MIHIGLGASRGRSRVQTNLRQEVPDHGRDEDEDDGQKETAKKRARQALESLRKGEAVPGTELERKSFVVVK